ncbi:MAG: hypothetical protein MH252_06930 [Thermosynechococcaceae cyanobacterium MS004]|nr:hypothetical protein [Thermosynechococcaceae cyanobacterium MS004]
MSNTTTALIELRRHYEGIIAQAEYQSAQASAQLEHIDALLVNGLLQAQEAPALKLAIASPAPQAIAPSPAPAIAPAAEPTIQDETVTESTSSGPQPFLPAYAGKTKLEAIAQVLSAQMGGVLHQDSILEQLYGDLSPEQRKVESGRLKASLFQGVRKNLWQRAPKQPSSYLIKVSKSKRQPIASPENEQVVTEATPTVSDQGKREPRPLLPAYQGLTRLEAIVQILQTTPGQEVTIDEISRALFGELSPAEHQAERKSLSTQLYKGVSLKRWQKGTTPSSFIIGEPTSTASTPSITPESAAPAAPAAPATKERTSLPLLPTFEGITKREAIAQVLQQHSGEILHQDTIIQTLYGDLSSEELKTERKRISTILLNGVRDKRWQKATVPSSYFLGDTAANSKPKRPSRKPGPSKEPQPEPVAEAVAVESSTLEPEPETSAVEEIAQSPTEAPAVKAKAARKPGRKPAIAKAKPKRKPARSKQSELELVALLRKADVQI